MQGDEYNLSFHISLNDGLYEKLSIEDIEVCIGNLLKHAKIESDNTISIRLTQEETFKLDVGCNHIQARCKFSNGDVIGKPVTNVIIVESKSKEVL